MTSKEYNSVRSLESYSFEVLKQHGEKKLESLRKLGRTCETVMYFYPGVGVCMRLRNCRMICGRATRPGDKKKRKVFTKSSGCKAALYVTFWAVVETKSLQIERVVTELTFPLLNSHNHRLDVFSVSASNTSSKLKQFIEECVSNGLGHVNTYIRTMAYASDHLVPEVEETIGKKISPSDTRFFPTKRSVYTYWMRYSGGSVTAVKDQALIKEFLEKVKMDRTCGDDFYYHYEPFDPKQIANYMGINLDTSFENLLEKDCLASLDFGMLGLDDSGFPVLPDSYFEGVADHLKPRTDSSARERYDIAVKLLIRGQV